MLACFAHICLSGSLSVDTHTLSNSRGLGGKEKWWWWNVFQRDEVPKVALWPHFDLPRSLSPTHIHRLQFSMRGGINHRSHFSPLNKRSEWRLSTSSPFDWRKKLQPNPSLHQRRGLLSSGLSLRAAHLTTSSQLRSCGSRHFGRKKKHLFETCVEEMTPALEP